MISRRWSLATLFDRLAAAECHIFFLHVDHRGIRPTDAECLGLSLFPPATIVVTNYVPSSQMTEEMNRRLAEKVMW